MRLKIELQHHLFADDMCGGNVFGVSAGSFISPEGGAGTILLRSPAGSVALSYTVSALSYTASDRPEGSLVMAPSGACSTGC